MGLMNERCSHGRPRGQTICIPFMRLHIIHTKVRFGASGVLEGLEKLEADGFPVLGLE